MLKGTFNTIQQGSQSIGGNRVVWSRVRELYQGGGFIDVSKYAPDTVIPAGSMVKFQGAGKEVLVIPNDAESEVLETVNGLVFEDVYMPEGTIHATCAVVRNGRIYADRVGDDGLPASIEGQLPGIEFVRED